MSYQTLVIGCSVFVSDLFFFQCSGSHGEYLSRRCRIEGCDNVMAKACGGDDDFCFACLGATREVRQANLHVMHEVKKLAKDDMSLANALEQYEVILDAWYSGPVNRGRRPPDGSLFKGNKEAALILFHSFRSIEESKSVEFEPVSLMFDVCVHLGLLNSIGYFLLFFWFSPSLSRKVYDGPQFVLRRRSILVETSQSNAFVLPLGIMPFRQIPYCKCKPWNVAKSGGSYAILFGEKF